MFGIANFAIRNFVYVPLHFTIYDWVQFVLVGAQVLRCRIRTNIEWRGGGYMATTVTTATNVTTKSTCLSVYKLREKASSSTHVERTPFNSHGEKRRSLYKKMYIWLLGETNNHLSNAYEITRTIIFRCVWSLSRGTFFQSLCSLTTILSTSTGNHDC